MSTRAMAVRVGSSGTEATSRSLFLLTRVDGLLPGDRGAALASAAPPRGWAIAFGDLPSFQLRAAPTASRPVAVDLNRTNRRGTAAHTAAKPPIPIPQPNDCGQRSPSAPATSRASNRPQKRRNPTRSLIGWDFVNYP